ncbi:hypothetical protein [Streptomyces sp. SAJ15]|uniref:hypothetical protein n=1 Tax=Streptomyces sp. SAJ15 TaxID=2011095 RepID=UPI0021B2913A|nr:hypothetical protein [Streptomyces sp. SAJ15]
MTDPYGPPQVTDPYGPPPTPYPGPPPGPAPRRRRLWWRVPFVGWLVPVLRSANRAAEKVFKHQGEGRIVDPVVDRVQLTRSLLGLLATLGIAYAYGPEDGWNEAAENSVGNLLVTPVLLIVTGPLVMLAFIFYAPPHRRRVLRSRLGVPLKTIGWYLLTVIALGGSIWAGSLAAQSGGYQGALDIAIALAMIAVLLWGLPFLFFASAHAARSAFNTAHVHAALPAVLTGVLVWVLALFNLIDQGMPNGPVQVQLCSLLGGPLTVTAVSLWELRRMRTRHGVTIRG